MSYKTSAKNRRIKKVLLKVLYYLKFEWLNLSTSIKIVASWMIIATFWLFWNWFSDFEEKYFWNAFHQILGITWYIILFLNLLILFFIFSKKYKNFLKIFFNIYIKDAVGIVFFLFFWLITTINWIFIIENIEFFKEGVILGQWIILVMVWYVIWITWWCFNLYSKTKTSIYINSNNLEDNYSDVDENNINKNNMKLPF